MEVGRYRIQASQGMHVLRLKDALDFRNNYDKLFWDVLHPLVADGIALLKMTGAGRTWLANTYAHVLMVEHTEVNL